MNMASYPFCIGVHRSIAFYRFVLVEVVWHGQSHEHRECKNELCPKTVEIAELQETKPTDTCSRCSCIVSTHE